MRPLSHECEEQDGGAPGGQAQPAEGRHGEDGDGQPGSQHHRHFSTESGKRTFQLHYVQVTFTVCNHGNNNTLRHYKLTKGILGISGPFIPFEEKTINGLK